MKLSALPLMMAMIPATLRGVIPGDIEWIKKITRATFPSVSQISTSTLDSWVSSHHDLALVDVRSPGEFAVSHLRDATNTASIDEIATLSRANAEVVLYCSVGFRSSAIAAKLRKHGISNLHNLEGSIFEWANENRPIYRGQELVSHIHPYSPKWAGLLKAHISRQFEPA